MVRRRAKAAGIATRIGNHTFRETGITAYLRNVEPKFGCEVKNRPERVVFGDLSIKGTSRP